MHASKSTSVFPVLTLISAGLLGTSFLNGCGKPGPRSGHAGTGEAPAEGQPTIAVESTPPVALEPAKSVDAEAVTPPVATREPTPPATTPDQKQPRTIPTPMTTTDERPATTSSDNAVERRVRRPVAAPAPPRIGPLPTPVGILRLDDPAPAFADVRGKPAVLAYPNGPHDFGTMPADESRSMRLQIRNDGGAAFEVESVHASRDELVAELPRRTFAPGDEGILTVTLTPENAGAVDDVIMIQTSGTSPGTHAINFTADVTSLAVISPEVLPPFDVQFGQPGNFTFFVEPLASGVEVLGVNCRSAEITATIGEPERDNSGRPTSYPIHVQASTEMEWGSFAESIRIAVGRRDGRHERAEVLRTWVRGTVAGRLQAKTDGFVCGVVPGGEIDTVVEITSTDEHPFTVHGAGSDDLVGFAAARLDTLQTSPNTWTIRLRGKAADIPGRLTGTVWVQTDVEGESRIPIPVRGRIRESG